MILLLALHESGYRGHVERIFGRWSDAEQRSFLAHLAATPYEVIEDEAGTAIGCLAVTRHADHDFVEDIVIEESHRSRGLGTHSCTES